MIIEGAESVSLVLFNLSVDEGIVVLNSGSIIDCLKARLTVVVLPEVVRLVLKSFNHIIVNIFN